jgi:hypothetical protein
MAVHKVIRTTPLAQPQPKTQRSAANPEPTDLMPVKAHTYRTLAEMNYGLEQAIQGLQVLRRSSFFSSDESLAGLHNRLSRIRAQTNRELMAILAERETANDRHFRQLCPETERAGL